MAELNLAVKHGQTADEARANFAKVIKEAHAQHGRWIRQVEWSADGTAWAPASADLPPGTTTWTDLAPVQGAANYYRVSGTGAGRFDKLMSQSRDAAQPLKKIERDAFGRED